MSSEELQRAERSGVLIELRRGGPRNLFLVHDGDGDTLLYSSLARRMPDDVAVFGVAPHAIPRVPLAHTRIEDMAGFYIDEVRKKQPHGPYLLGGLCAGGVIAYEMALQLSQAGEPIELVALLDAATPQAPKRRRRMTWQRLGSLTQGPARVRHPERSAVGRAYSVLGAVVRKLVNKLAAQIMWLGERLWVGARFYLAHQLLARQLPWPRYIPELLPLQICVFAGARYVPKPLRNASAVVLVRARRQGIVPCDTPFCAIYADGTLGWAAVTQDLAIVDVDGGHATMLQEPFVEALAAALIPYIKKIGNGPIGSTLLRAWPS